MLEEEYQATHRPREAQRNLPPLEVPFEYSIRDALSLESMLAPVPVIKSVHPSPLSASGGFFGSKPFSRANASLLAQGAAPIDWTIPA